MTAEHSKAAETRGAGQRSALSRRLRATVSVLSVLLPLVAASQAVAQDQSDSPYEPPKYMTVSPLGVDLGSGKFNYSVTDLSIGPLTLERSYAGGRSLHAQGQFGLNWGHNHSAHYFRKPPATPYQVYGDPAVVIDGKLLSFYRSATGYQQNAPDSEGTFLEDRNGAMVFTDQQGNVYTFNPSVSIVGLSSSQRIARIDYANGHTITYTYSSAGKLTEIASNFGYSIVFENNGPNGHVSRACGYNRAESSLTAGSCANSKLVVGYSHTANPINPSNPPFLTSVSDALRQTWGYRYPGNTSSHAGQITCIEEVNSSVCRIKNEYYIGGGGTKPYWVLKQTTANNEVWSYNIQGPDPEYNPAEHNGYRETTGGGYTDPEGNEVWVEYYSGQPVKYYQKGNASAPEWNGSQSRVSEIGWDGLEMVSLKHPEGNSVHYSRRGALIVGETYTPKLNSGLAPVFTSSGFPERVIDGNQCDTSVGRKRCNKPLWKEDFNRNRAEFTYDAQHGGVLTETGPAVNGVRPQKRYTYVARAASAAPAGMSPIWLVNTVSFCRTANFENGACRKDGVAIAGDEVVTSFEYEPNNLKVRSETVTAGGISRRTCFTYDWLGNQTSATASNGTCS